MKDPVSCFYLQLRCHNIWFGTVKAVSVLLTERSKRIAFHFLRFLNRTLLLLSPRVIQAEDLRLRSEVSGAARARMYLLFFGTCAEG